MIKTLSVDRQAIGVDIGVAEQLKERLPELCWGSMWLSVGTQGVHTAEESQWERRA